MSNRPSSQQRTPNLSVQGQGHSQIHISTSDIPNLGVDVRFESLKKYLDEISGAVNQHAIKINSFEKDLGGKVETQTLAETINMICEGLGLFDNDLSKIARTLMGNGRMENTMSPLENSQNRLINRELQLSHSVTYVFQKMKKFDPKMIEVDKRIDGKVETQLWKEKKKKHKQLFKTQFEDLKNYVEQRIKETNKRVNDQVKSAVDKSEDIEKKTIWRINELENTIKSKINAQYVEDSCRAVEEKIRREFAQHFIDSDRNLLMYNELKAQLKYVDDQNMEKIRANKKQITDLEELVDKRFLPRINFEEKMKVANDKIYDLQQRLKELDKKQDLQTHLERQSTKTKQLEEKLQALDQELQRKFADIMLHQQQEEYKQQQKENLHKLCNLEGLIGNMQNDLTKSKNDFYDIQNEIVHRMEQIEADFRNGPFGIGASKPGGGPKIKIEDVATQRDLNWQVDCMKSELSTKLQEAIDGVYKDMKKMNEDERTIRIFTQLNEIQRRHEQLEARVAKTTRELDMHSLVKQLREKAETDSVKKDFAVQESKIIQLSESLTQARKDIDNMGKIYAKLIGSLRDGTISTAEEQLVVMSKRLLPANCISCTTGKMNDLQMRQAQALKQAHKNDGYILGSDKRPYKVDVNYLANQQAQLSEQLITQTQQALMQNQLSHIQSDMDMVSVSGGGPGYVYLDKSHYSQSMPSIPKKKGMRPSTAKVTRKDSISKRVRPESAKDA